jgi:hypothetical protein
MKPALIGLLAALLAVAGVTWLALESGGVAIIETLGSDGAPRSTHVWFVEHDGELWLEAGTRENGWFVDVLVDPELAFDGPARAGRYRAHPVENPVAHKRIRTLIRDKYGWRDWWVGFLIVDSSQSVAVRLDRLDDSPS